MPFSCILHSLITLMHKSSEERTGFLYFFKCGSPGGHVIDILVRRGEGRDRPVGSRQMLHISVRNRSV